MTVQPYAVIATAATTLTNADGTTTTVAAGTVINRVLWDGASKWTPPAGSEARADPDGTLPIGSITSV